MAEVLREENDTDHRYRITQTDRGFLVSSRQKSHMGLIMGPAEWLYRTREAADKGLDAIMLMNAWWLAITRGYPARDLPERCEAAAKQHEQTVERMNDRPLVGPEVRELRQRYEADTDL